MTSAMQSFGRRQLAAILTGMLLNLAAIGQSKVETEIVGFTAQGFTPLRITRGPGPFQLAIHDATRIPSLEFSLFDASGKPVQSGVKLGPAQAHSHRSVLTLGVGTYTLRITELPTHSMTIVISPNGR
jgi:hypothetical protein